MHFTRKRTVHNVHRVKASSGTRADETHALQAETEKQVQGQEVN